MNQMRIANTSNGRPVPVGDTFPVENPATLEIVGLAPLTSLEELEAAVAAAREAVRGPWGHDSELRRQTLGRFADRLAEHVEELAGLLSQEQGKPMAGARAEINYAIRVARYYEELADREEILRANNAERIEVVRTPLGAVALVTPWNVPIIILMMKLGPALFTGNAVVIKPAPTTPLSTLRMVELVADLFPAGVLNTVTGGADIGAALVSHPDISKISFTGSTPTGKMIMQGAASTLKRLTLELGGNDAAIIMDDVDVDEAAPRIFRHAFGNAGQICVAIKRLYVHDKIYPKMVDRLHDLAREHRVGPGSDPSSEMGPVNNLAQKNRVLELLDDARSRGGTVMDDGVSLPNLPGHFLRPTIVTGLDASARLVAEEQFGPALPVMSFSDVETAVDGANASEYGLGASVWSADLDRAAHIARRLEAGNLYVNQHATAPEPAIPFGGMKSSGFGHEFGEWGLDDFSVRKVLTIALSTPGTR